MKNIESCNIPKKLYSEVKQRMDVYKGDTYKPIPQCWNTMEERKSKEFKEELETSIERKFLVMLGDIRQMWTWVEKKSMPRTKYEWECEKLIKNSWGDRNGAAKHKLEDRWNIETIKHIYDTRNIKA